MKRYSILAGALAMTLHGQATAQPSTAAVDLIAALAQLRAAVSALPSPRQSPRLRSATEWLVERPAFNAFNPADVSAEYARSLQRAAELLREQPASDVIEDVTAELEAKVEHCRKLGIGMGGLVNLKVNTLRGGKAVSNWRVQFRLSAVPARVPASRAPDVVREPVYDAFLSYRHTDPDTAHACELLEALESRALRVAIDIRDFAPNEHFLSEMERCIKESRFVLCVVTPRYVDSDHCSEEAIISKTLDMADRRKRLVPLIFERVELPVWLHGLVGIDFTGSARIDPVDRLLALVAGQVGART